MGNFGASYFGKDQEAAQWAQIAGIASRMNDKFEKEHISSAYETLKNGESLPDDTRDSIKVNATKLLRDNLEGETVAAEQQIMADIASKSKEQGVGIHDYLKGNVESYLTTPASYRAVGNISKMFQERQLADANYQKAKMEEGVNRFKEVSSLVQAADGLYKKGDLEGSRKMVEQISKIIPIPGFAKANEETGELEGYTTDFDKGGHKPAGMKFDVGGFLNAAKQVTRDEFAYGYALNSQVVNEMNAKNLAEASIMKDKGGGRYMGFNFVNPYDATDTKFIVKQEGTGKTVGQFASMQDATDSGYTPYNQKYEEGERKIKYMDEDQAMQRQGFGADMMLKNLNIQDKKADMSFQDEYRGHQRKEWEYKESLYPTKEEMEKEKLEKLKSRNRITDDKFSESILKGITTDGAASSSDDQIRALGIARELRPYFDDHVMPAVTAEILPRVTAAVQGGESPEEAIKNMAASKLGMPRAIYDINTNKNFTPEQKAEAIKNISASAVRMQSEKTGSDTVNNLLDALYSMDSNTMTDYADSAMPSFMYNKGDNRAEVVYALSKATGLDAEGVSRLYEDYSKTRKQKDTAPSEGVRQEQARTKANLEKQAEIRKMTGRDTGRSMGDKVADWLERNGMAGY